MIRYAPYIDGTIPAFTNDGIIVPFQHNLAVGEGAAAIMVLKIKDLNGNTLGFLRTNNFDSNQAIFNQWSINYEIKEEVLQKCDFNGDGVIDVEDAIYLFYHINFKETYPLAKDTNPDINGDKELTLEDASNLLGFFQRSLLNKLEIGQYYKIQLSYMDKFDLLKDLNSLVYSSIGVTKYIGDITYYIESINENTGKVTTKYIHDSDPTEIEYKEEIFLDEKLVDPNNMTFIKGKNYEITARLTTINGYVAEATYNLEGGSNSGIANLYSFKPSMDIEYGEINAIIPERYSAIRSKSFDSYENIILPDNTVEHGEIYYYGLKDQKGNWRLKEEPIVTEFEDMFLQDKDHMLRIKFNPKVSSFKRAIQESKITTLGSKYPFFFRNGDQNFAEFSINGLLSYYMQDSGKFVYDYDLGLEGEYTRPRGSDAIVQLYEDSNGTVGGQLSLDGGMTLNDSIRQSRTTNLVNYNIHAERKYRDLVYNWLNNGQPKLFRSPTEGNFVVRLMDISMSPEDQLGRMLYNFSCSATECAAADDYATLKKLNLV